jgi:hypothetical protein
VGRFLTFPLVAFLLACLLLFSGAAQADRVTIPANAPSPWTANSPLEALASRVASHIAGRPVTVGCETYPAWHALGQTGNELGLVQARYDTRTNTFVADATAIELAPQVCRRLQQFAQAVTKPTKCRSEANSRFQPCFLGRPISHVSTSPGICATSGCFSAAARRPTAYWRSYHYSAEALLTLAHETIHIEQDQAGAHVPPNSLVEAQATCSALQWLDWVAVQFGDTLDDAQAIATFAWKVDYPAEARLPESYARSHPYWSAQCKPGGSLDIRAGGSTFWP